MTIGIDLSPLQGPHRLRGIGSVLINFINCLPPEARETNKFIFYTLPESFSDADPLELLDLTGLTYEIRQFGQQRKLRRRLPGKLNLIISLINQLVRLFDLRFGDSRIKRANLQDLDAYFQVDPLQPLPAGGKKIRRILMLHDLIPYILEKDYLWTYATARGHGYSRKAALRVQMHRNLYTLSYRAAIKHADHMIANSKLTKNDFVSYLGVKPSRITVTHLGVTMPDNAKTSQPPNHVYRSTSWGYRRETHHFDTNTPFLLFVGGADRRRKLEDLVTAFNHLRAQGVVLKLVLVGDSMQGPMNIATVEIQDALKKSSYLEDIIFMGFVNEEQRNWLYKHALAFVYPSVYEGFGLPVLEALSYGCPVLCYPNRATKEVAAQAVLYEYGSKGLMNGIKNILNMSEEERRAMSTVGINQASHFEWSATAANILRAIQAA